MSYQIYTTGHVAQKDQNYEAYIPMQYSIHRKKGKCNLYQFRYVII